MYLLHTKLSTKTRQAAKQHGFTLVELLIVIAIIAILSQVVYSAILDAREHATMTRAEAEFRSIETSLQLYIDEHGEYPPDTDRDIPPGLEEHLAPGIWPDAAWPNSVFDWDNWAPNELSYPPKEHVYQISVRFCPVGGPLSACRFPNADWAEDFDVQSAVYFCIEGPCRSHSNQPPDHPGRCVNC